MSGCRDLESLSVEQCDVNPVGVRTIPAAATLENLEVA